MNFAAVILAGGKSSRMGRDKARLELDGQSLLARQIALVRKIGAAETFISGRAGADYSDFGCPVLCDPVAAAGPLGGIASALGALREPLLLVLAVDMVNMTDHFLEKLHVSCRDGGGAVPIHNNIVEPLAAFYPRTAGEMAQGLLAGRHGGVSPGAKDFARSCVEAGWASFVAVPPEEEGLFKNWNCPADLRAYLDTVLEQAAGGRD
jgi:molybdopterin-guanine dinucleotide biosynthesis protein A